MLRSQRAPLIVSLVVGLLVVAGVGLALLRPQQGAAQSQGALLEYPSYPPTPTIGAQPALSGASLEGALAQATFDDASALAGWQFIDLLEGPAALVADYRANWLVADGRLVQDFAGEARSPSLQEVHGLLDVAGAADVAVTVSFYDEYNGVAGLVARYTGSSWATASYYRFRALKDSYPATPKLVLEKVDAGAVTSLVEIKGPGFAERAWHTLGLRVVGGQLTATLDGQVVAEAEDPRPLPAGLAGIYTRAIGGIHFDDFLVTAP